MPSQSPSPRSTGTLTIVVQTAGGALPVPGAKVTVSDAGGSPLRRLTTDENGRTPTLILEAPPVGNSLFPGGNQPYAVYQIRTEKEGFYATDNHNAPIFAGINSVQPVELIPKPPYESNDLRPRQDTDFSSGQQLN